VRAFAVFAVVLFPIACQTAPPDGLTSGDRAAIEQLSADYRAAALAGDWAAFAEKFTPDGVYQIPEAPTLVGREEIMANAEAFPVPTEMNLMIQDLDGSGNWAWLRGNWMFAAPGMRMEGSVLWVLEKQSDGTWLIDTECYNLDHPGDVPSPDTEQVAQEVEAALDEWWAVWSAAEDFDRFMTFFADDPDVHWIGDAVPHFGPDAIDATFRPVMENMQRQENTPVEWRTVVVAPDIAYTVRINDVAQTDIAGNPGVEGRYAETILWVKRNGQWKVLTGHGSAPNDVM
jgi:uncharacterized protein (TIGR02246 family)